MGCSQVPPADEERPPAAPALPAELAQILPERRVLHGPVVPGLAVALQSMAPSSPAAQPPIPALDMPSHGREDAQSQSWLSSPPCAPLTALLPPMGHQAHRELQEKLAVAPL